MKLRDVMRVTLWWSLLSQRARLHPLAWRTMSEQNFGRLVRRRMGN